MWPTQWPAGSVMRRPSRCEFLSCSSKIQPPPKTYTCKGVKSEVCDTRKEESIFKNQDDEVEDHSPQPLEATSPGTEGCPARDPRTQG